MYPSNAPRTDAIVQIEAKRNAFEEDPSINAINNGSGGIGKKDDSAKAKIKSAGAPYGVSAQCSTQL